MALGVPLADDRTRCDRQLMNELHCESVIDAPVTIVGGGLAGSAVAAVLAQAGWKPLLIERDIFPRDKLCGEFLSGESQRLLRRIGCLEKLLVHEPPVVTQGRFVSASGKTVTVGLPEPAYGISRRLLDETLFRHACDAGAVGLEDSEVRSMRNCDSSGRRTLDIVRNLKADDPVPVKVTSSLTIAAYGRHARLDHNLERPFLKHLQPVTGFKLHHRPTPGLAGKMAAEALRGTTEVYGFDNGYCGINFVEGGVVNVCMLMQKRALGEMESSSWGDIAAFLRSRNTALAVRLDGLVPVEGERVLSVSRMMFHAKEQALQDDLLFIGDAAGMIAPLCGDGQAMALESGVMLGELISGKFASEDALSKAALASGGLVLEWQRAWNKKFGRRMRVGRALQHALLRPSIADVAIGLLHCSPKQFANYLARVTRS